MGRSEMKDIRLHIIAYSAETRDGVPDGYGILDNMDNPRPDWREYWAIRKFLLAGGLDENALYGFFSPKFPEKVGLTHAQVVEFINSAPEDRNVFTFSPQPDMGAFFLNVFEQAETMHPGFTETCKRFFRLCGVEIYAQPLIMDSRHVVFSNFFVASPAFWRQWLEFTERLFAICEGEDCELKSELNAATTYPDDVQIKVFVMERVASLLLAMRPEWRTHAYNPFLCAWSTSRLNQLRHEAVMSDALKIAMREQGYNDYLRAFAHLRAKIQ
jgi:hypothetical protein